MLYASCGVAWGGDCGIKNGYIDGKRLSLNTEFFRLITLLANGVGVRKLIALSILIALQSCDSRTEWHDGNYEVVWIDTPELSLYLNVGEGALNQRVGPEVIAVGANSKYITVKQRDPNTKLISFYFIEKATDGIYKNSAEVTKGPFSESEFQKLSTELDLPKFSKEFYY